MAVPFQAIKGGCAMCVLTVPVERVFDRISKFFFHMCVVGHYLLIDRFGLAFQPLDLSITLFYILVSAHSDLWS